MNTAVTQADGEMIAHSVEVREKSLAILRTTSRPHRVAAIALIVLIAAVTVPFYVFSVDFPTRGWPQMAVGFWFFLSLVLTVVLWNMNRRLMAVIDLLLLNEGKRA